jgi:hypothetical protein
MGQKDVQRNKEIGSEWEGSSTIIHFIHRAYSHGLSSNTTVKRYEEKKKGAKMEQQNTD